MKHMRHVWETPYGNAILKIERANKHIAEFQERLFASSDRYGPSLHMDGNTGEQFLYYGLSDRFLRGELALIAGDAIHNLRSALDIAWVETVNTVGSGANSSTYFPIRLDQPKQWLESVLAKNAGINPASRIFDFLVNHVKGYKGGDSDILALHDLDINDKHYLLTPMVTITGVKGVELENPDGTVDIFDIVLPTDGSAYRRVVPLESKLKNHGEVRFYVTFGKGTAAENLEIIPTLETLAQKVGEIIRWLQRMR
jgi:hypothetical protein